MRSSWSGGFGDRVGGGRVDPAMSRFHQLAEIEFGASDRRVFFPTLGNGAFFHAAYARPRTLAFGGDQQKPLPPPRVPRRGPAPPDAPEPPLRGPADPP